MTLLVGLGRVFVTMSLGVKDLSMIKVQLNGFVVLVHDSNVSRYKILLHGYPMVYGIIKEAKGLEFKKVL